MNRNNNDAFDDSVSANDVRGGTELVERQVICFEPAVPPARLSDLSDR